LFKVGVKWTGRQSAARGSDAKFSGIPVDEIFVAWITINVVNLDVLIGCPAYAADVLVSVQHFF
jgi:hypothetical protein